MICNCKNKPLLYLPVIATILNPACRDTSQPASLNFILIMADDVSAVDLGCYGSTEYQTPNIDSLAKSGALFNVCWSTALSMPSRIQIMTGRYATSTGWYGNDFKPMGNEIFNIPGDSGYTLSQELFFSKLFRDNGYITAISGKWHIEDKPDWSKIDHSYGFDEFCLWGLPDSLPSGYERYGRVEGASGPYWDVGGRGPFWQPAINVNGKLGPTGEDDFGPDYFTSFINTFIDKQKHEKFLVYYPMTLAHSWWYKPISEETRWGTFGPVPELDPSGKKTGRKTPVGHKYAVEYADHLIGRIIKKLEDTGLRENTIIIFTSDNGSPGKGKGYLKSEDGIRVPLIINCPGIIPSGKRINSFAQLADILPSMADLAEIDIPDSVSLDGISFVPALKSDTGTVRDWLYSYVNYDHAFRYKDYYLDGEGSLWYCEENEQGKISYSHIADSLNNSEITHVRKELARLQKKYPKPDTIDNPMYERFKLVNEYFYQMINNITK